VAGEPCGWRTPTARGPEPAPTAPASRQRSTKAAPRRLWDTLEDIRDRLNTWGELPVYGAKVTITPDGETTLSRGRWSATL
jgi:hypothetical protein